jgi:hypothetical protein
MNGTVVVAAAVTVNPIFKMTSLVPRLAAGRT